MAFDLDGRVSLRRGSDQQSLVLAWRHRRDEDWLRLETRLGQSVAELNRDPAGARLRLADGRHYEGDDWLDLAGRLFGSRPPLDRLPAWLAGGPAPEIDGWQARVVETQDGLPVLLELRRDDVELRLRIDQWRQP